jgi:hypothetical protein
MAYFVVKCNKRDYSPTHTHTQSFKVSKEIIIINIFGLELGTGSRDERAEACMLTVRQSLLSLSCKSNRRDWSGRREWSVIVILQLAK